MPEPAPDLEQKEQEEVYLEWKSPSRPFKKRNKQWFVRLGLTVLVITLFLIFFKQFLLVFVVLALTFVAGVLAIIEPEMLDHRITSQGVSSAGRTYLYKELNAFYFTRKYGQEILNVEIKGRVPSLLQILLGNQDNRELVAILKKYLPFREIAPVSFAEKVLEYAAKRLSLD